MSALHQGSPRNSRVDHHQNIGPDAFFERLTSVLIVTYNFRYTGWLIKKNSSHSARLPSDPVAYTTPPVCSYQYTTPPACSLPDHLKIVYRTLIRTLWPGRAPTSSYRSPSAVGLIKLGLLEASLRWIVLRLLALARDQRSFSSSEFFLPLCTSSLT